MPGDPAKLSWAIEVTIQEHAERNGLDPADMSAAEVGELTLSNLFRRCLSIGADPCAVYRAALARANG